MTYTTYDIHDKATGEHLGTHCANTADAAVTAMLRQLGFCDMGNAEDYDVRASPVPADHLEHVALYEDMDGGRLYLVSGNRVCAGMEYGATGQAIEDMAAALTGSWSYVEDKGVAQHVNRTARPIAVLSASGTVTKAPRGAIGVDAYRYLYGR